MYNRLQFINVDSREVARDLFSSSVTAVHIESSSYCNRRCSYCPISTVDRISSINYISDENFEKILSGLSEISYSRHLSLSIFNEPLADRHYIARRIRQVRLALPQAIVYLNTNGDYLDAGYLDELAELGVREMYITLHPAREAIYDDAKIARRFEEFQDRTTLDLSDMGIIPGVRRDARTHWKGIAIRVFSVNYTDHGQTRGGLMKNVAVPDLRTSPCDRPFADFTVSYTGDVFPCCQLFSDSEEHRPYRVGNIADADIFTLYTSAMMVGFRRHLFVDGPKLPPCDRCTEGTPECTAAQMAERRRLLDGVDRS